MGPPSSKNDKESRGCVAFASNLREACLSVKASSYANYTPLYILRGLEGRRELSVYISNVAGRNFAASSLLISKSLLLPSSSSSSSGKLIKLRLHQYFNNGLECAIHKFTSVSADDSFLPFLFYFLSFSFFGLFLVSLPLLSLSFRFSISSFRSFILLILLFPLVSLFPRFFLFHLSSFSTFLLFFNFVSSVSPFLPTSLISLFFPFFYSFVHRISSNYFFFFPLFVSFSPIHSFHPFSFVSRS